MKAGQSTCGMLGSTRRQFVTAQKRIGGRCRKRAVLLKVSQDAVG